MSLKEYRVLSQSDSFWGDRFSPLGLQEALNKLADVGWRVIAITTTEFTGLGGLGTKRHELFVVLERDRRDAPVREAPVEPQAASGRTYDASRIPANRFYKDAGRASSALKEAGLVDEGALTMARNEMAKRGGHLCDHLLALGFVTEDQLRTALKL